MSNIQEAVKALYKTTDQDGADPITAFNNWLRDIANAEAVVSQKKLYIEHFGDIFSEIVYQRLREDIGASTRAHAKIRFDKEADIFKYIICINNSPYKGAWSWDFRYNNTIKRDQYEILLEIYNCDDAQAENIYNLISGYFSEFQHSCVVHRGDLCRIGGGDD